MSLAKEKKISKFIYFYSDLYEFYNVHLQERLKGIFDIEAIKIPDFKTKRGHTFYGGVSIKIELVLKKINENMNKYIIFTDATIFINKEKKDELYSFFSNYLNNDICFADNIDPFWKYNIGIMLIHCSEKTKCFFEDVLHGVKNRIDDGAGWDQQVLNALLNGKIDYVHELKLNTFSKREIVCGYSLPKAFKTDFLIFKSFIKHTKNSIDNFNKRIDIFYNNQLISDEEYIKYKKVTAYQ